MDYFITNINIIENTIAIYKVLYKGIDYKIST